MIFVEYYEYILFIVNIAIKKKTFSTIKLKKEYSRKDANLKLGGIP